MKGYGKKQRYIHGILNDTLKVYDMVYQQYFNRNIKRSYTYIYIYQRYVKGMFFRYRDVLDGISDLHQRYPKGILEARTLPIKLYLYKGILKVY